MKRKKQRKNKERAEKQRKNKVAIARRSAENKRQRSAEFRYKSCERKKKYSTEFEAWDAAKKSMCYGNLTYKLTSYFCQLCRNWHLTKKFDD